METIEDYVDSLCDKYVDAELEYHIETGIFYYDMHNIYDNEILINFPKGSNQIFGFMDDLDNMNKKIVDEFYYTENWGTESGNIYDRLWIWWK